jgi:hypothetical protein
MNMTSFQTSNIYPLETYSISCDDLDIEDFEDEEHLNLLHRNKLN